MDYVAKTVYIMEKRQAEMKSWLLKNEQILWPIVMWKAQSYMKKVK